MNIIFSRATESIPVEEMRLVAERTASTLSVSQPEVLVEPFGDYSPDAILPRIADLRERYLDQGTSAIFILFDQNAVQSHGCLVLGRAVAQSRVAVVTWRPETDTTTCTTLHELGHILGHTNRHCEREACIMYPYARDRPLQNAKGQELFCEDCWRTITTDTLYESVRNSSQAKTKINRSLKRIGNAITSAIRPSHNPPGTIHPPRPFPVIRDYPDEYRFLQAVLQYYGVGEHSEEAEG
jgi:hypothetical protein